MKDKRTAKLYDSMTDVDNQFIREASEISEIRKEKNACLDKMGNLGCLFLPACSRRLHMVFFIGSF